MDRLLKSPSKGELSVKIIRPLSQKIFTNLNEGIVLSFISICPDMRLSVCGSTGGIAPRSAFGYLLARLKHIFLCEYAEGLAKVAPQYFLKEII